MKYGFVIPVFNHGSTLESVVKNITPYNLPIIIVDDGNDIKNKTYIKSVISKYPLTTLVERKKNGGKGLAMKDGIIAAYKLGLTHIFQLDSDGQHDTSRVKYFIEQSKKHPSAVICGYPEYDKDAPMKRVNGRKVANTWVHIVTLSRKIKDSMIGFRIYPLKPCYDIETSHTIIDARMGFDIDLLVHLAWKNINIINEMVKVSYPLDGVSNFRAVRDNIRISAVYTRLCIGMILKLPYLLTKKFQNNRNKIYEE